MADQFDAFKKEVEEDLQRERMQKLWKDYGTYIIVGCVAVVLGVAGYKALEANRIAAAEAASLAFSNGVKALTPAKAAEKNAPAPKPDTTVLAGVAATTGSYGMLAKLRLAAAEAAAGEMAKAVATYDALAQQSGVDQQLADYARLQSAMLTVDTASWTDTQNRVNDLTLDSSPWRHAAREVLGVAAYKAGKVDEAKAQFTKLITDPSTPRSIADRVGIVMAEIAQSELAKMVPALPAQAPVLAPDTGTDGKAAKPAESPAPTEPAKADPPPKKKK